VRYLCEQAPRPRVHIHVHVFAEGAGEGGEHAGLVVDPRAAGEVAQEQLAPLMSNVGWCDEKKGWVIAVRRVNEREKRGLEAKKRKEGGGW
jgi:hypothetical protein